MGLLVIGLGPIGHMLARAIYLNGSLDKWYLSLIPVFWVPPFSIGTLVAMIMGFVKKGEGQAPLDWTLLISFFGNLIIPLIFNSFELNEGFIGAFFQALLMFIVIIATMYIHERINCKEDVSFTRVIMNASIANLIGIVVKVALSLVFKFTPVRIVFMILEALPGIGGFIESLKESLLFTAGSTTAILGTNMYQSSWLAEYCKSAQPVAAPIAIGIVSFFVNMGYVMFKNYAPI